MGLYHWLVGSLMDEGDDYCQRLRKSVVGALFFPGSFIAFLWAVWILLDPGKAGLEAQITVVVMDFGLAVVYWLLYALLRRTRHISEWHAASVVWGSVIFLQGGFLTSPDIDHQPVFVILGLMSVLLQVPKVYLFLGFLGLLCVLSDWNTVHLYEDTANQLVLKVFTEGNTTDPIQRFLFAVQTTILLGVVIFYFIKQVAESERRGAAQAAANAMTMRVLHRHKRYDTGKVSRILEECTESAIVDPKLIGLFQQMNDNLESYRPYLPNYLFQETDEDESEEENNVVVDAFVAEPAVMVVPSTPVVSVRRAFRASGSDDGSSGVAGGDDSCHSSVLDYSELDSIEESQSSLRSSTHENPFVATSEIDDDGLSTKQQEQQQQQRVSSSNNPGGRNNTAAEQKRRSSSSRAAWQPHRSLSAGKLLSIIPSTEKHQLSHSDHPRISPSPHQLEVHSGSVSHQRRTSWSGYGRGGGGFPQAVHQEPSPPQVMSLTQPLRERGTIFEGLVTFALVDIGVNRLAPQGRRQHSPSPSQPTTSTNGVTVVAGTRTPPKARLPSPAPRRSSNSSSSNNGGCPTRTAQILAIVVKILYKLAKETKASVHSMLGDTVQLTWNATHSVAMPETKGVQFLCRLREFFLGQQYQPDEYHHLSSSCRSRSSSIPTLRLNAAVCSGKSVVHSIRSSHQQALIVETPWLPALEGCFALAKGLGASPWTGTPTGGTHNDGLGLGGGVTLMDERTRHSSSMVVDSLPSEQLGYTEGEPRFDFLCHYPQRSAINTTAAAAATTTSTTSAASQSDAGDEEHHWKQPRESEVRRRGNRDNVRGDDDDPAPPTASWHPPPTQRRVQIMVYELLREKKEDRGDLEWMYQLQKHETEGRVGGDGEGRSSATAQLDAVNAVSEGRFTEAITLLEEAGCANANATTSTAEAGNMYGCENILSQNIFLRDLLEHCRSKLSVTIQ